MQELREKIMFRFLRSKVVSFSTLQKELDISSSKLSYHLEKLQEEKIVAKVGDRYVLSESYKSDLPYFDSWIGKEKFPIAVVLVVAEDKGQFFVICRKKEPFLGHWGFPTTKIKLGESTYDAAKRILKKHRIEGRFSSKADIVREKIIVNNEVSYDYFLFVHKVEVTADERFLDLHKLEDLRIIPTDLQIAKSEVKSEVTLIYENDEFS